MYFSGVWSWPLLLFWVPVRITNMLIPVWQTVSMIVPCGNICIVSQMIGIIMIEHAGMKEYFDGSRQNEQITFFGITNLSILAYMLDYKEAHPTKPWKMVRDIPVETCRHILKRLIIPQRLVVEDIPRGRLEAIRGGYTEVEGRVCKTLEGEMFVYTYREDYNYIPEKGEIGLYIYLHGSGNSDANRSVSTDIQMNNGVVHALSYGFSLKGL